ncbi:L-threonine dehydratase catabolic TdcB [Candidatus Kinetoplastibacterium sorsogonicusi]|uniref:L-threonine dehydratase catabolic TdcB n=1 Tax=Candidatus Kinetoplastidibacterium kentomonadis TaxID=1576550 RepID=A0A3Q8F366_9PROT|nr:pyridoxal-phosphate dependent enzyme [Candidatus Kinetoplastibacterium sorsogonicusi]AWD32225.1 L-threonine dehydratase catabolic TdcB [Candidatus Kinetoplastibacterium sorsogonicusi]
MQNISSKHDIIVAANNLKNIIFETPIINSLLIDDMLRMKVFFKCENLQHTGSFKFRGAFNAVSNVNLHDKKRGIVSFSSGNHGQAMSLACKILKYDSTILMPIDAPLIKINGAKYYGSNVIFYNRYTDDREKISQDIILEKGFSLISPYDNNDVISGAGTIAKEIFEKIKNIDAIMIPLGGGSLLSGCATYIRSINSKCKIYGIEPENGNDGQISFRNKSLTKINVPNTIADGAQTQQIGYKNFEIIKKYVDDIFTVKDSEIINAMNIIAQYSKLIVEPTGAMGLAFLLKHKEKFFHKNVVIILSGGNIDINKFCQLINKN